LSMLDYLLCSCIEYAWLFVVFVYWVCLIICCVRVLSMLDYLLYSCNEYAYLLAVFVHWVCLITRCVRVLDMLNLAYELLLEDEPAVMRLDLETVHLLC